VGAEVRVNVFHIELAISRTIYCPAPIVTDHFPCSNTLLHCSMLIRAMFLRITMTDRVHVSVITPLLGN
jgi:hypothetical protein